MRECAPRLMSVNMRLYEIIWKDYIVNKLAYKHRLTPSEVEEALFSRPHIRYAEQGKISGEDLYAAYGRTEAGRYIVIFFLYKPRNAALPISARDMTDSERRYYEKQTNHH